MSSCSISLNLCRRCSDRYTEKKARHTRLLTGRSGAGTSTEPAKPVTNCSGVILYGGESKMIPCTLGSTYTRAQRTAQSLRAHDLVLTEPLLNLTVEMEPVSGECVKDDRGGGVLHGEVAQRQCQVIAFPLRNSGKEPSDPNQATLMCKATYTECSGGMYDSVAYS